MTDNLPCGCPRGGKRLLSCAMPSAPQATRTVTLADQAVYTASCLDNMAAALDGILDSGVTPSIATQLRVHAQDLKKAALR